MTADVQELNELSRKLKRAGIAGFCPTTLSASHKVLLKTVTRLGEWILSTKAMKAPGARPLGIHLEGPYIHPHSCGAHPLEIIRPLKMVELDELWNASRQTLKILTVAPELLSPSLLKQLTNWARKRRIILSLGHSQANEKQAEIAFQSGFSGITHAWNALPFHHRAPGALGAALGQKGIHIEVIIDLIHVAPTLIRWTRKLHPEGVCFVSDCAPAAATHGGKWIQFGDLETRFKDGACRLKNGSLAGGGLLLSQAYEQWLKVESQHTGETIGALRRKSIDLVTVNPLRAIGLKAIK